MTSIRRSCTPDTRGVSSVVGEVIMVGILVILASIVGAAVLSFNEGTQAAPIAGAEFEEPTEGTVIVQITSMESAERVQVITTNQNSDISCPQFTKISSGCEVTQIGDEVVFTGLSAGDRITVLGLRHGETNVLYTYTSGEV